MHKKPLASSKGTSDNAANADKHETRGALQLPYTVLLYTETADPVRGTSGQIFIEALAEFISKIVILSIQETVRVSETYQQGAMRICHVALQLFFFTT